MSCTVEKSINIGIDAKVCTIFRDENYRLHCSPFASPLKYGFDSEIVKSQENQK
jgi:hypothetical protein